MRRRLNNALGWDKNAPARPRSGRERLSALCRWPAGRTTRRTTREAYTRSLQRCSGKPRCGSRRRSGSGQPGGRRRVPSRLGCRSCLSTAAAMSEQRGPNDGFGMKKGDDDEEGARSRQPQRLAGPHPALGLLRSRRHRLRRASAAPEAPRPAAAAGLARAGRAWLPVRWLQALMFSRHPRPPRRCRSRGVALLGPGEGCGAAGRALLQRLAAGCAAVPAGAHPAPAAAHAQRGDALKPARAADAHRARPPAAR